MTSLDDEKRRVVQEAKLKNELKGKDTGVAILLSFFLPGLGDLYCGSWIKAIIFFILDVLNIILVFAMGIGFFSHGIVWFFGLISAALSAKKATSRNIARVERSLSQQA